MDKFVPEQPSLPFAEDLRSFHPDMRWYVGIDLDGVMFTSPVEWPPKDKPDVPEDLPWEGPLWPGWKPLPPIEPYQGTIEPDELEDQIPFDLR